MSPEHNKLSYKFKILPTGTPAILAPRRIRIRERPDLTDLCSAFHTMKIVASWTSRSLNKQNSNSILSYITECFTHANSCIFCYTKRKRTKNLHSRNCLSKISLGTILIHCLGERGEEIWEDFDCVTVKFTWSPPYGLTYPCDPPLLTVSFLYYPVYTLLATTDPPSIPSLKTMCPPPKILRPPHPSPSPVIINEWFLGTNGMRS